MSPGSRTCRARRAGRPAAALLVLAGVLSSTPGCTRGVAGPRPDPSAGVARVEAEPVQEFYQRTREFYRLLEGRRFNSLVTFRDPALRGYFRSDASFSDYYADLAQALADAHFERNRPLRATLEEFQVEGAGQARVRVRLAGESGLPLRWWSTSLVREDVWQRLDGRWWIVPGRL